MRDDCNCAVVWTFFGIALLWAWNENWPFPVLVTTAEFSKFAGIVSAALSQQHLFFSNFLFYTGKSWLTMLCFKCKAKLFSYTYTCTYSFSIFFPFRLLHSIEQCSLCYTFFFSFIFISWRLIALQYCSGFCHTLTWISHGFTCIPHPYPPPTSLSTQSLWVFPVHQVRALVSCIQLGLVICFTLDNIHVSMLFSWNIPPSPSPTESKSLFCTSVSLFLFCI